MLISRLTSSRRMVYAIVSTVSDGSFKSELLINYRFLRKWTRVGLVGDRYGQILSGKKLDLQTGCLFSII